MRFLARGSLCRKLALARDALEDLDRVGTLAVRLDAVVALEADPNSDRRVDGRTIGLEHRATGIARRGAKSDGLLLASVIGPVHTDCGLLERGIWTKPQREHVAAPLLDRKDPNAWSFEPP